MPERIMRNYLGFQLDPIIDNLEESVYSLIQGMRRSHSLSRVESSMERQQFLRDFKTIRVGLPRSCGNSSLAYRLLARYEDSFLITWNKDHMSRVKEELRTIDGDITWCKNRIYSKGMDPNNFMMSNRENRICLIDMASILKQHELDRLYALEFDFYILVG